MEKQLRDHRRSLHRLPRRPPGRGSRAHADPRQAAAGQLPFPRIHHSRLEAQGIPALDLAGRETQRRHPLGGRTQSRHAREAVLAALRRRPVPKSVDRLCPGFRPVPHRAPRRVDMSEPAIPVAHRDSPYFGLEYYDEKFGPWFFGREAEGSKIITNLRAARLTLLHAESGVGKSSLLRAGVAWRMRRLADDSLARRGTARSVPIVFSSWKDDPS